MLRHLLVVSMLAAGLGACTHPQAPPAAATVGGQPISKELFDYFVRKQTGVRADQVREQRRAQLLEELKKLTAAAQIDSAKVSPDVQQEIDLQRLETLAHAAAVGAGVFATPTDRELSAAYEQFKAELPTREYHVAHILVATEGLADGVIARLRAGEDFAKVAKDKSADDSRDRGGDIGWIAPGKLPGAFMDAVPGLKVGEFTKKPVKTAYGWHIIRLVETRPTDAPPFEEVKAQIAANLQQERYQAFLDQSLKTVGAGQ
jgi:peptidyl-prolyl cis-trans isomerase C